MMRALPLVLWLVAAPAPALAQTCGPAWTVDTLAAEMNARLADMDRRYSERFEAQQLAIQKADTATEKRLESVNEFRKSLNDQAEKLMPRQESQSLHAAARERIDSLASRLDKIEGQRSGVDASWIYLIGFIATLGTLVSIYAVVSTSHHHATP